jgi:hypothetical protein
VTTLPLNGTVGTLPPATCRRIVWAVSAETMAIDRTVPALSDSMTVAAAKRRD